MMQMLLDAKCPLNIFIFRRKKGKSTAPNSKHTLYETTLAENINKLVHINIDKI